jgi:organic hydroperoxide reductase OsmC/OhrA
MQLWEQARRCCGRVVALEHEIGGVMDKDLTVRVNIADGSSVTAFNPRDGLVHIGTGGEESFSPVELLLAAVGGCAALDFTKVLAQRGHLWGASAGFGP